MTSLASKLLLYLLFNDSCHSSQMTHVLPFIYVATRIWLSPHSPKLATPGGNSSALTARASSPPQQHSPRASTSASAQGEGISRDQRKGKTRECKPT